MNKYHFLRLMWVLDEIVNKIYKNDKNEKKIPDTLAKTEAAKTAANAANADPVTAADAIKETLELAANTEAAAKTELAKAKEAAKKAKAEEAAKKEEATSTTTAEAATATTTADGEGATTTTTAEAAVTQGGSLHKVQSGGLVQKINYELHVSMYIQKILKLLVYRFLLHNQNEITLKDYFFEVFVNMVVFEAINMYDNTNIVCYLIDQIITLMVINIYIRITQKEKWTLDLNVVSGIVLAPYYIFLC